MDGQKIMDGIYWEGLFLNTWNMQNIVKKICWCYIFHLTFRWQWQIKFYMHSLYYHRNTKDDVKTVLVKEAPVTNTNKTQDLTFKFGVHFYFKCSLWQTKLSDIWFDNHAICILYPTDETFFWTPEKCILLLTSHFFEDLLLSTFSSKTYHVTSHLSIV